MPICPVFKQIGERFGGFDLAVSLADPCSITHTDPLFLPIQFIPIGAFSPRAAFSPVHASPDDAVQIHLSVKSQRSIGMHWGCWTLSDEPFMQDPQRLEHACIEGDVDPGEFHTLYIGETLRQATGASSLMGVPSKEKVNSGCL
jgi:N-acyl-phosphatidylethanolamine-hydrolysing phospholipase D